MNRHLMMLRLLACRNGYQRANFARKHGYFRQIGEGSFVQPANFGTEPHLISFGRNVYVASGVQFITHDVVALMLRRMLNDNDINERVGTISVGDNVFIGANTTLLYGTSIGSNTIVGAGSLVVGDLPSGVVCVGRPAKPVGDFNAYVQRSLEYSRSVPWSQMYDNPSDIIQKQIAFFWGSDCPTVINGGEDKASGANRLPQ